MVGEHVKIHNDGVRIVAKHFRPLVAPYDTVPLHGLGVCVREPIVDPLPRTEHSEVGVKWVPNDDEQGTLRRLDEVMLTLVG